MVLSETANTIKNVWDLFKDANEIANKTENLELQRNLNELQQQIIFLERQLNEKERQILDFEKQITQNTEFVFQKNMYWKDEDGSLIGPFCPACKDGNQKIVRLTIGKQYYKCPVNECNFVEEHTKADPIIRVRTTNRT